MATVRARSLADSRRAWMGASLAAALTALAAVSAAPVAVGTAVAALALGYYALRSRRWSPPARGELALSADGRLTFERASLVEPGRAEYVLAVAPMAFLVGANGHEHYVEVGAALRARLLARLDSPHEAVTVRWRRHHRGLLALLGGLAALGLAAGAATGTLAEVPVLGGVVATLLVAFAVWLAPRTDSITIGAEALAIRKAVERVVPLVEIEEVEVLRPGRAVPLDAPRALGLVLRDGSRVRVEVGDGEALLLEGLRTEIERRRAIGPRSGSGRGILERLVRDGRSASDWAESLAHLLKGSGGFRDGAVSDDDVLRVLEDAHAPAEARVGAALALAGKSELGTELVREVAAAVASPRLRVALEEAAASSTSDELVEAAAAEEAHAVGRAR